MRYNARRCAHGAAQGAIGSHIDRRGHQNSTEAREPLEAGFLIASCARLTPTFAGVGYAKLDELGSVQGPCSEKKTDRLVHMANQIADFFAAYPREEAIVGAADHLKKFWDPRMRRTILDHVQVGGAGLRDVALDAVRRLGR